MDINLNQEWVGWTKRRIKFIVILLIIIILSIIFPIPGRAETKHSISMQVNNAPLQEVVKGISRSYGLNIIGIDSLSGQVNGLVEGQDGKELIYSLSKAYHFMVTEDKGLLILDGRGSESKENGKGPMLIRPKYKRANSIGESIKSIVSSDKVALSPDDNQLIVYGSAQERQTISSLLSDLDVKPKQVALEVTLLAFEQSYLKETGIRWSWNSLTHHGSSEDQSYGSIRFGRSEGGDSYNFLFKADLSANESQGKAMIIAKPSIMTMHGKEANILIGERIPVVEELFSEGSHTSTIRYEESGIRLHYTPYVTGDGCIDADISAEVSNPIMVNEMKAYKISTRQASTRVRMKPGDTLIIGGLMDNRSGQQVSKIPFLGDIPLLGKLFRHSRKTKDYVELVMLVEARVIEDL